jgi:undecaprenyl-diphosphatase
MSDAANGLEDHVEGQAVERSPVDVLRLAVALTLLLALVLFDAVFGNAVREFQADLLRGLDAFNVTVITIFVAAVRVVSLTIIVLGTVWALLRGRLRFLVTVALGAALAAVIAVAADWIVNDEPTALVRIEDDFGPLSDAGFPSSAGLAAVAGIVAAGTPWFSRRQRRFGWLLVVALGFVRFIAAPVSANSVLALLAGLAAGAASAVILGAPSRRPTRAAAVAGLRAVGVDLATLEPAAVDARGSTPYFGTTAAGQRLFVKVLGADERSADLLFRLYRYVVPRDFGDERPFESLRRAVEHEALCALAAQSVGVRTPQLAGFGVAPPGGYVLAYEAVAGRSLDRVDDADLDDARLDAIFEQVATLRAHGMAHRDLRLANLFLGDDGKIWLIDFGFSELAASELLLATDLAELVTSLSLKVGPATAVEAAERVVGRAALDSALPRLAAGFLSGATRTGIGERPDLLPEVRARIGSGQSG